MPKLLIVDDHPGTRTTLSKSLKIRHPDWKFESANDHLSAINKLRSAVKARQSFDVVITDLWMGKELPQEPMGGEILVKEVPKVDPHLVAIVYTAEIPKLDRYRLLEAGAYDVIERDRPGLKFADEIDFRVRSALNQRDRMRTISMLSRFFDINLLNTIQKNPDLLELSARKVTVVFWDIRGFSALCEALKAYPAEIANFLREYCDMAAGIIFEQDGVLDKYIGDGVMAIFGVPPRADDEGASDAVAAVEAAKKLSWSFGPLLEDWLPKWKKKEPKKIDIGLGCGVHTGDMLVGALGTGLRDQFTALGPHVNLTSRIENRAEKGQILISASTNELVKRSFTTRAIPPKSDLKGIEGNYELYEVL